MAIEHSLGRWEQARARLIRSLGDLEDATASARAELELELALSHLFWMDFESAAQWANRSAATAGSTNRPLSASAIALLAFVQACTDDLAAAAARVTEAAALLDRLYDSELVGRMDALYYLGRAEYLLEDFPAAERHLRRGLAAARLRGGSRQLAQTKIELARTLVRLGHLAEARDLTQEVIEATEDGGQDWLLGLAQAAQVTVLRALGEIQGARAAGERAARLTEAAAAAELAQAIRRELALLWLDEGDPQRCLSDLASPRGRESLPPRRLNMPASQPRRSLLCTTLNARWREAVRRVSVTQRHASCAASDHARPRERIQRATAS